MSQTGTNTPAPKRASILSSLDYYGRYNPISQQGIDLTLQDRKLDSLAYQMMGAGGGVHDSVDNLYNLRQPSTDYQRYLLTNRLRSHSAGASRMDQP